MCLKGIQSINNKIATTNEVQVIGYIAIVVGLIGMWLAARHSWGWLLGTTSGVLWIVYAVKLNERAILLSATINSLIQLRNFIRVWLDEKHIQENKLSKETKKNAGYAGYL